jgi:hypothetical protein
MVKFADKRQPDLLAVGKKGQSYVGVRLPAYGIIAVFLHGKEVRK